MRTHTGVVCWLGNHKYGLSQPLFVRGGEAVAWECDTCGAYSARVRSLNDGAPSPWLDVSAMTRAAMVRQVDSCLVLLSVDKAREVRDYATGLVLNGSASAGLSHAHTDDAALFQGTWYPLSLGIDADTMRAADDARAVTTRLRS